MRKTVLIILSILALALGLTAVFTGCTKIKKLANINVDIPYNTTVNVPDVPGLTSGIVLPPGGLELPSVTAAVQTNSQAYLAQYGTSASKIVSVSLKSLTMQIQSPPEQNFNFLDNIQVYISAKSLPEIMIASADNIPKGVSALSLTVSSNVDLKNYFLQDTVYLRMAAHINTIPQAGETLGINTVFHMVANPLN